MLNVRYPGLAEQKIWSYMMPSLRSPWSKLQSMAREPRRWWRRRSPAGCNSLQAVCWRSPQERGILLRSLLSGVHHCHPGKTWEMIEWMSLMTNLAWSCAQSTCAQNQVFISVLSTVAGFNDGNYCLLQLVCGGWSGVDSNISPAWDRVKLPYQHCLP